MKKLLFICVMVFALCLISVPAFSQDSDGDGIADAEDNCILTPNGPDNGTCTKIRFGLVLGTGTTCTDNSTCEEGETCQMEQGDCNTNGIGDVCECYADFDNNTYVGLSDLGNMKSEFGRRDCDTVPCDTDCTEDGKVSLQDAVIYKIQLPTFNCPN